jgi:hypothetical protein
MGSHQFGYHHLMFCANGGAMIPDPGNGHQISIPKPLDGSVREEQFGTRLRIPPKFIGKVNDFASNFAECDTVRFVSWVQYQKHAEHFGAVQLAGGNRRLRARSRVPLTSADIRRAEAGYELLEADDGLSFRSCCGHGAIPFTEKIPFNQCG